MSSQFSFKQTETDRMPQDWEVVRLGDIGELQYGYTSAAVSKDTGIKFLRITDINGDGKVNWETTPYCEVSKNDYEKYRLNVGDVLFARIGATTGKTAFVDKKVKGVFASYLIKFRPVLKELETQFIYYFTQSNPYWIQVHKNKEGQLKKGLNATVLGTIELPLPPLPEQKKIAEILSTVDQAIEKVDEAMEKTQRLKKGLMQELLTKGIGHKEFKDTDIGRIPKEWEIRKLGGIGKLERGKFAFRPRNDPRFYGGKFPFIQTGDINEANGIIKTYSQTLNEEGFKISKLFKKGTIVISIAGNIGDVGILNFDSCFPDSIVGINGDSDKVNNLFLMYLLQKSKRELDSIAPRSTQKNINLGILEAFKLPLPSLPEQQKIAEILSAVDERLELLRKRKERLGKIKKGLMNDLLTGKVRVTHLVGKEA